MLRDQFTYKMTDGKKCRTLGPGGGGALFVPCISAHDPAIAMTATDMTGGFITYDGGAGWEKFNLKTRMDALAFDPSDPNTFYAGSSGVFRSRDSGHTWNLIFPNPKKVLEERTIGDEAGHIFFSSDNWPGGKTEALRVSVLGLEIDAHNPGNLYAGVLSNGISIFRSDNDGEDWTEVCRLQGAKLNDLYLDTNNGKSGTSIYMITENGIYTAKEGDSASFHEITLPFSYKNVVSGSCGYDAENGRNVFVLSVMKNNNGFEQGYVYRSTDNGETWVDITASLLPASEFIAGYTFMFNQIRLSRAKGKCAYISYLRYPEASCEFWVDLDLYGILKSEDCGSSWKAVLTGSPSHNPQNKNTGWLERDYDARWQMTGPKGSFPLGLAVGPNNPEVCYVTDHGSCYRTYNGGDSWEIAYSKNPEDEASSSSGLDMTTCYGIHFDPHDAKHWAVSYTDMGFFHTRDGGESWIHSINGMDTDWGNTCYWVAFDPDVKGRAWGAWASAHDLPRSKMFRFKDLDQRTGGVARTEDGFATWKKSNNGLPENSIVTHILLDPESKPGMRTLYATVCTKGVYKSSDDGYTWQCMNKGLGKNLNAWHLVRDRAGILYLIIVRGLEDGSIQYDSTAARGFGSGEGVDGELYRSVDKGETWEKIPLPAGVNGPNDLAVDPENSRRMYLACWPRTKARREYAGGVWSTEDGGKTWNCIFDESCHVYGITIDEVCPSRLYINTFEEAAFRSEDFGRSWNKLKHYSFKWGHRVFIDPCDRNHVFMTTFGGSLVRVLAETEKNYG